MSSLKVKICQFQENEHFENHPKVRKAIFLYLKRQHSK